MRGHKVTLCEKASSLGGNLIPGGGPGFKEDDDALIRWYDLQLKKFGVDVQAFNKTIYHRRIKSVQGGEIILATGSNPKMLKIPGAEMLAAEDVLTEKADAGKSTIIIGGGLVGCETSLWLKRTGT